jgi:hypothetical protein
MNYGVLIIGLLAVGYGVLMFRSHQQRAQIKRSRVGDCLEKFVKEFDGLHLSRCALDMAHMDLVNLAKMPVRRSDDLEKTLGFVPEDFERMVEKRCRQLGVLDVWKSRYIAHFPLKTVEDYVRLLGAIMADKDMPPQQSRSAGKS